MSIPDGRLREAIEDYITKAETYRLRSELLFNGPISITQEMMHARDALRALLASTLHAGAEPEELNIAAPQPKQEQPEGWSYTLKSLAKHLGWGDNLTDEAAWKFMAERERLLRGAQGLLEVHLSDAPTAEDAIRERIEQLSLRSPQEGKEKLP